MKISTDRERSCPVTATLSVIGGRWKPIIIYTLSNGSKRFGQLAAFIPGISRKVLTDQLKELERDGLVLREEFKETPPRVEYSLTRKGASLGPVLLAMCEWGQEHLMNRVIEEKVLG